MKMQHQSEKSMYNHNNKQATTKKAANEKQASNQIRIEGKMGAYIGHI